MTGGADNYFDRSLAIASSLALILANLSAKSCLLEVMIARR